MLIMQVQTKSVSLAKWGTRSILQRIHPRTHVSNNHNYRFDIYKM